MAQGYRKLNLSKLSTRKHTTVSMKDAIKDVTPIEWSKEVKNGSKKITISRMN